MRIIHYTNPLARPAYPVFANSPWAGLESQINRLFETALRETVETSAERVPVDIYEDTHATYIRAELPGVNRADIGVELLDGTLQLRAKRTLRRGDRDETREFARALTVPEGAVQPDKISATYENGVLTVTLPKREEAKPRSISVNVT